MTKEKSIKIPKIILDYLDPRKNIKKWSYLIKSITSILYININYILINLILIIKNSKQRQKNLKKFSKILYITRN